ncbi:hypothetical protein BJ912DRAFT_1060508 [Pholiota molesta]|nr:hypothetical protein BJ912DRAFT_1060508 [Pholiota molesta]
MPCRIPRTSPHYRGAIRDPDVLHFIAENHALRGRCGVSPISSSWQVWDELALTRPDLVKVQRRPAACGPPSLRTLSSNMGAAHLHRPPRSVALLEHRAHPEAQTPALHAAHLILEQHALGRVQRRLYQSAPPQGPRRGFFVFVLRTTSTPVSSAKSAAGAACRTAARPAASCSRTSRISRTHQEPNRDAPAADDRRGRTAAQGGTSRISSSWRVDKELTESRPDVVKSLRRCPSRGSTIGISGADPPYMIRSSSGPTRTSACNTRGTSSLTSSRCRAPRDVVRFRAAKHALGLSFQKGDMQSPATT